MSVDGLNDSYSRIINAADFQRKVKLKLQKFSQKEIKMGIKYVIFIKVCSLISDS
jgi:hypothetical protein